MLISNRVKERIGINAVSTIVENLWECGWQEYAAQNDDAIDGVILMRRGSRQPSDTGGMIFVQVKCGGNGYRQDQVQYPNHICIQLGKSYINKHRPRWAKVPGPAILIFVDDTVDRMAPPAWWVDLRDNNAYSPTNDGVIIIPKNQKFSHHTKGIFRRLCGTGPIDRELDRIELSREDIIIPKLGKSESLRSDAWEFYKKWRSNPSNQLNPTLGKILVNRVGWKHITRKGRLSERIIQSWLLLGAAKKIITNVSRVYQLGRVNKHTHENGNIELTDFLGLRAIVTFPYRHESVIHVVLLRKRILKLENEEPESQKIWFYTVYELRRGQNVS